MDPRRLLRPALAVLAAIVVVAALGALLAKPLAVSRARAAARARGLTLAWERFDVRWPARADVRGLTVLRTASGDTLLTARSASAEMRLAPLLLLRARPGRVELDDVGVRLPPPAPPDADTLAPPGEPRGGPVAPAVLQRAQTLPALRIRGVSVTRGSEPVAWVAALALDPRAGGATEIAVTGTWHDEDDVPFDLLGSWRDDDHLTGRAQFDIPEPGGREGRPLVLSFDGRVSQDRRARELRIAPGSVLRVGTGIVGRIEGLVARAGPRFRLDAAFDGLGEKNIVTSLPRVLLGPLAGLDLQGTFDWHAGFDLDLARPDSVHFHADVIPHELWLDPRRSRPSPAEIEDPFTATILLPRGRIAVREIGPDNPHYRPLDRISPYLRDAVVTNEDGAFWRHHGFNTEAIGLAVAANLRAGAYKRGAGTITMQLARNLWLGHRRTLARKGQEVALAWIIEHLSGLSKERLLEVYLNVIEWGPGVQGADEAAQYFFDTDAGSLSLDQALFLATVVPAPSKWRWRFGPDGSLRPFERAQMHFIASKMAAKGRLDPALVPPADSIRVELRGPARELFEPAADSTAAAGTPE